MSRDVARRSRKIAIMSQECREMSQECRDVVACRARSLEFTKRQQSRRLRSTLRHYNRIPPDWGVSMLRHQTDKHLRRINLSAWRHAPPCRPCRPPVSSHNSQPLARTLASEVHPNSNTTTYEYSWNATPCTTTVPYLVLVEPSGRYLGTGSGLPCVSFGLLGCVPVGRQ